MVNALLFYVTFKRLQKKKKINIALIRGKNTSSDMCRIGYKKIKIKKLCDHTFNTSHNRVYCTVAYITERMRN